MKVVASHNILCFLADDQDRTYYVEGGVVKKNAMPKWIQESPNGIKDATMQWATNDKYQSTIRQFTTALTFVKDGQQIIADRMINGAGIEEVLYLIILKRDPSMGLNGYRLEVKMRVDMSKFKGNPRKGIAVNTLQDDVFALVQANENTKYPIQCNSTNPAAIKVLFDGTLLQDKINYQPTAVDVDISDDTIAGTALPLTLVNNEGDSVGTISNSQDFETFPNAVTYVSYPANGNNALSFTDETKVNWKGSLVFDLRVRDLGFGLPGLNIIMIKSTQTLPVPAAQVLFSSTGAGGDAPFALEDKQYSVPIDINIDLATGEKLFFLALRNGPVSTLAFKPVPTIISAIFSTKQVATIAYALRPLDYLKQLVSAITNGKYTADSKFFARNNRKVILSGSSLRSFPDSLIMFSFADFYKSYHVPYNLGVTVREGVLWIEPVEDIYNSSKELINLGNISDVELSIAEEKVYSSVRVGYIKQTYNKRNGRYEYNCTHTRKFPISTVQNELDLVSPARCDSFGMEFIRTNYSNLDTTDDKGDSDVFTVMISDSIGQTDGEISTALTFTVVTLILASPIIKTPLSSTVVYNQNPTITGICQPFKTVNVFADGVLDGQTVADAAGNWAYQIQTPLQSLSTIFNGVHLIEATAQTDPTNVSGFSNAVSITVNTSIQSPFLISSPTNNDTLYNNLPIISGIAPSGKVITVKLDGVTLGTCLANNSGIWNFGISSAIPDGDHVVTASTSLMADATISITVNKNVSSPLITSVVYGDVIYNKLPLIKGVAIPATVVSVYLDGGGGAIVGGVAGPMGTAVADANGDWSFQVVSVTDSSGFVTAYIPDGLHVLSTTATPVNVLAAISGYRLMRGSNKGPVMDYDAIKLDDQYIPPGVDPGSLPPTLGQFLHSETLYNIEETSPLRCLLAHANTHQSFLFQQKGKQITFNGAEVNANLSTKKNGVILCEGGAINVNDLGPGLYYYWYLTFKAKVPLTFNQIMNQVENDGYITGLFNGLQVYFLPIGNMTMKIVTDEAQQFKLLISTKTPLATILQLFNQGQALQLGPNMIYTSDRNPIHFVAYNYTPPPGFHFSDIYQDWQKNRHPNFISKSSFVQPFMKVDPLPLQFINTGVGTVEIVMISAITGKTIDTFSLTNVAGKIQLPNLLQECDIDLSGYDEDDYWFAMMVGSTIIAISEPIALREDWPETIAVDYGGITDLPDFYFSTGISPRIRLPIRLLPWMTQAEIELYEDENGDFETTRGLPLKVRTMQIGHNQSLVSEVMAIKMNTITSLDKGNWFKLDGVQYSRDNNSKFEKVDLGKGVVDCIATLEVTMAESASGVAFAGPGDTDLDAVAYVLDATAFGQNDGVINVTADEE